MKKKVKKAVALGMSFGLLLGLAGCSAQKEEAPAAEKPEAPAQTEGSGGTEALADAITLKFACDDTSTSSYYLAILEFEKEVEEKSGGAIQVECYGDAQLGSATETIEGMQLGTVECVFASTAALAPFVEEFAYVDAPFIFRDADHAHAVVDGEIGQMIGDLCVEKQGIRLIGWYDTAFRNIYTTREIRSLEDLKGLKIRTMQSDLHLQTFEALGCLPVSMASSEVYTSLSQGTIDAAENNYSYVLNQSLYEVIDYIISTGHFYGFCPIMIAENVYQSLTPEQQEIVMTAAANSVEFQRELCATQNEEARGKLEELGVEFIELDREELRQAVQPVYDNNAELLDEEIIEKINAM